MTGTLPLSGVRVFDGSVVWAGTFCTMLLADLGAEVIKVENPYVFPPSTRGTLAHPPATAPSGEEARASGYPRGDPRPRPWNYSPTFVQLYRNKRSMTVDWGRPEGRDVLARLIAKCDVLVENNAIDVIEKMGLTYDWVCPLRPDIVMVRMPAYGLTGPYADARAFGVHLEAVIGHTLLRGYQDAEPTENTAIFPGDAMAGAQAALAVMMALWHRKQTGEGQLIEMAQAENATAMLAQAVMDYSLNGVLQTPVGNRSVHGAAPCGVYPARPAGTAADGGDRWIALTVATGAEWQALRTLMGDPDWAGDPAYASEAGRAAAQDVLDARIAEWTQQFDDYDLMQRLQAAGIAAAPVLEASRTFSDPHIVARRFYEPQRLFDDVGTYRFMTPFYHFPETPVTVYQPPVALGEHNEYVYKEVIGVSDSEYEALRAGGHIAMEYDSSVP